MKTKTAVWSSVVFTLVVMAAGIGISAGFGGGRGARDRAETLGQGMGVLAGIGLAAIWGWWFMARRGAPSRKSRPGTEPGRKRQSPGARRDRNSTTLPPRKRSRKAP